jgi:hypothetical protein
MAASRVVLFPPSIRISADESTHHEQFSDGSIRLSPESPETGIKGVLQYNQHNRVRVP